MSAVSLNPHSQAGDSSAAQAVVGFGRLVAAKDRTTLKICEITLCSAGHGPPHVFLREECKRAVLFV